MKILEVNYNRKKKLNSQTQLGNETQKIIFPHFLMLNNKKK